MKPLSLVLLAAACCGLAACNPAFHDLGSPAPMTPPDLMARTQAFVTPPTPEVVKFDDRNSMANNSIWSDRHGHLFRDSRAFREGTS